MEIRNVYVIVNTNKFTKERVVAELQEEGYKHNFFFGNVTQFPRNEDGYDIRIKHIKQADEVWCFGDCSEVYDYKLAKENGADIWQMA